MPSRRALAAAPLILMAAVALTGCSSGGGYSDLDREAQDSDRLPAVANGAELAILPETSRLVGTHEGAQLHLMRSEDDGVCLLIYPDDEAWSMGCAGAGLRVDGYAVVGDGETPPDGATAISENVYAL